MELNQQPIMFENGEMTQCAVDELYDIDYSSEDILKKGISYIKTFENSCFFCEGLFQYIKLHTKITYSYKEQQTIIFESDLDKWSDARWKENWEDVFSFVVSCYAAAGIPGDRSERGYNKSVLKDWLSAKKIPSPSNRESFYKFCFALHMNEEETAEFFLKAFLVKPFNYKRMEEMVYYFCLKYGKSYADACRIIDEVTAFNEKAPQPENGAVATMQLGSAVAQIASEEKLKNYLQENRTEYTQYNESAVKKIKELYEEIQGYVKEEYEKEIIHLIDAAWDNETGMESSARKEQARQEKVRVNPEKKDNRDAVLNIILGFAIGCKKSAGDRNMDKIQASRFVELIKVNFPQSQQLSNIFTQAKPSDDAVRKTLILFEFYCFFAKARANKMKAIKNWTAYGKDYNAGGEYFDEFIDSVNEKLFYAGFSQMYWKHPYDWMFGFCAGADDPIQTFRDLVSEFCIAPEDEE